MMIPRKLLCSKRDTFNRRVHISYARPPVARCDRGSSDAPSGATAQGLQTVAAGGGGRLASPDVAAGRGSEGGGGQLFRFYTNGAS